MFKSSYHSAWSDSAVIQLLTDFVRMKIVLQILCSCYILCWKIAQTFYASNVNFQWFRLKVSFAISPQNVKQILSPNLLSACRWALQWISVWVLAVSVCRWLYFPAGVNAWLFHWATCCSTCDCGVQHVAACVFAFVVDAFVGYVGWFVSWSMVRRSLWRWSLLLLLLSLVQLLDNWSPGRLSEEICG